MKIKKTIMILLFILGGLELAVGIGMGFYPSLVLGSCLLYGAVVLRNRMKKRQALLAEDDSKELQTVKPARRKLLVKGHLITASLLLFSIVFICTSLLTSTFPGIVTGVFFGFFGLKRILPDLDRSKERSTYHADDSRAIH